jgi:hypothetical protein
MNYYIATYSIQRRLSTLLRESLQPTISALQTAIDYWSVVAVRQDGITPSEHIHYTKLVGVMKELKEYIIEQERYSDEELCISSGSNGGLLTQEDDVMEALQRKDAGSDGHSFTRSNT